MAFVRAASTAEVPAGTIQEIRIGNKTLAVANVDGKFHAISNECLHQGGPLGCGAMDGAVVTCPWHGWQFDVTSGKIPGNADVGVASHAIAVRDGEIFVDL